MPKVLEIQENPVEFYKDNLAGLALRLGYETIMKMERDFDLISYPH